jgi:hypothetical protein
VYVLRTDLGRSMTIRTEEPALQPRARATTWWFLGILVFMLLIAPMVPGLPSVGPLIALGTPVRRSRWRMVTLWGLAALHVVYVVLLLLTITDHWPQWLILDDEEYSV